MIWASFYVHNCYLHCIHEMSKSLNYFIFWLLIELWEFLIYSGWISLFRYRFCKYFISVFGLSFHFLNIFWRADVANFDEVQFSVFLKVLHFLYNKLLPNLESQLFFTMFSSRNFIIFIIHLDLWPFEVKYFYGTR
jgi:hypothetical protein